MREIEELFDALSRSEFRRKFRLNDRELQYLREKTLPAVLEHARDFIAKRLAPALIANDGKQTPYRGHPVFVGQHATACCCRECLHQWHGIEPGRELTRAEQDYLVAVLSHWLCREMARSGRHEDKLPRQMILPELDS